MAETLNCFLREEIGKGAVRKLRNKGFIPGVIYGHKAKTVSVYTPEKEFTKIWSHIAGKQVMLDIIISKDGKETKSTGFLQEFQQNPITGRFVHLDFHQVRAAEKVRVAIPVELVGEASGIKEGGIVDHLLREVEIEALPKNLPEKFTVDVGNLNIGDTIYVSQLTVGEGVKVLNGPEDPIVSVLAPKKEEVVAEEVVAPVEEELVEPKVISEEVTEERRKKKEEGKKGKEEEKKE